MSPEKTFISNLTSVGQSQKWKLLSKRLPLSMITYAYGAVKMKTLFSTGR